MIAVVADTNQFELMRRELTEEVFESPEAKQLFIALEECYEKGDLSFSSICESCGNPELVRLITEKIMTEEYKVNTEQIVKDSIELIRQKELLRQKDYIINRIKMLNNPSTAEEIQELNSLLHEKMNIDAIINSKKMN